ncbi:putative Nudix hydrolase [Weizmannia acidilactici]|uniref:Nudix hydrolase n=1 Tax=Weizmannia acidilactici TaxID=2607726 RepID=A0A5J4JQA1_9BACI|nr:NUDIX domain-containing protein [Weizmannia acidilactici]GER66690.1 putative Nudix hydrolase [Weizmannia acidilactici]GER71244.1 putative Nudix hydrolase [Weizmannia acidilactici]GER72845.1 putative Nudix hydrolase [Weizmannia acidilactici]
MESERLKIFDENGAEIGTATRAEVHKKGLWHETFHLWLIGQEKGAAHIYFQIRSPQKKDFPNKLDITAAGHLLAHESVEDGIREVKEELGLDLSMDSLVPVGTIPNVTEREGFIDREICHIFLHKWSGEVEDFRLQKEEVAGIVKASLEEFAAYCERKIRSLHVEGFMIDETGRRHPVQKFVQPGDFAPHESAYYAKLIEAIGKNFC